MAQELHITQVWQSCYSCLSISDLFTVLVAHKGFTYDFPILLAEVERRSGSLDVSAFTKHQIHFADTYPLLQKVNKYSITICYTTIVIGEEGQGQETGGCAWPGNGGLV